MRATRIGAAEKIAAAIEPPSRQRHAEPVEASSVL
jgi:hypothetical protein